MAFWETASFATAAPSATCSQGIQFKLFHCDRQVALSICSSVPDRCGESMLTPGRLLPARAPAEPLGPEMDGCAECPQHQQSCCTQGKCMQHWHHWHRYLTRRVLQCSNVPAPLPVRALLQTNAATISCKALVPVHESRCVPGTQKGNWQQAQQLNQTHEISSGDAMSVEPAAAYAKQQRWTQTLSSGIALKNGSLKKNSKYGFPAGHPAAAEAT